MSTRAHKTAETRNLAITLAHLVDVHGISRDDIDYSHPEQHIHKLMLETGPHTDCR